MSRKKIIIVYDGQEYGYSELSEKLGISSTPLKKWMKEHPGQKDITEAANKIRDKILLAHKRYFFEGKLYSAAELANILHTSYYCLIKYLKLNNYDEKKAVEYFSGKKLRVSRNGRYTFKGLSLTEGQWCNYFGISNSIFCNCMYRHPDNIEEAFKEMESKSLVEANNANMNVPAVIPSASEIDYEKTVFIETRADGSKRKICIFHNEKGTYQWVNITKRKICPCEFPTYQAAFADLIKYINSGKIVSLTFEDFCDD